MFLIKIHDDVIIDPTTFISFYNEHFPVFIGKEAEALFHPKKMDGNHLTLFGYLINVKATVFQDLDVDELQRRLLKMKANFENMFRAFFNLEIYNYRLFTKGYNAFFFPSLDFIKFVFWNYEALSIPNFGGRVRKINAEILSKSELVLPNSPTGPQSTTSEITSNYINLLDQTYNFCSEFMFATLCHHNNYKISEFGNHDFIINNNVIAEVKNIHDKILKNEIKMLGNLIQKTLPNSFTSEELKEMILSEITRKKWICHLKKAINGQKGDIVFFNVTQSPGLYEVLLFLEQTGSKKSFKELIDEAMRLKNSKDSIPVIAMLENIHSKLMRSFFLFTAPIIHKNGNRELDFSNFNKNYLNNTLIF